jgi:transcriptional regulator with XRE-family HTH domain
MAKQIANPTPAMSPEIIPMLPTQLPVQTATLTPGEIQRVQVDSEAAEAFISEKRIGERIKYLRLKKSMGLVELGRHTGLSASFLSQLETGRVVPTLRNLARISMVFSKDLSYFFDPEPQTLFRVHRQKDRLRLPQSGVEEPAYFFESLGYLVPDRQLDPYFAEFLPAKAGREPRAHQHVGCEFLYLLSGNLAVRHGETTHHLEAGDAVYFDANTIHSYACTGDVSANAVIVTLQNPVVLHLGGSRSQVSALPGGRMRNLNPTPARPAVSAAVPATVTAATKRSAPRTQ